MDATPMFKACIKTVNLRNKDLGIKSNNPTLLKKSRSRSGFSIKSQGVVIQITKLKEFLLQNRKAYLNFSTYLSNVPHMTDADRDQIDSEAQKIMSTCSQLIKELKREIAVLDASQQLVEHREIMMLLMEEYLKNVCKIYSEQKAIRVKKAIEMRKVAKLQLDFNPSKRMDDTETSQSSLSFVPEKIEQTENNINSSNNSSPMKIQEINGDINNTLSYEDDLSAEDIQVFESENEQLFNELNTLTEEVKQIESKVVHIAELQEIFTEKVLDQDKNLDRLMTTVVGSTENVKEANEQIRQAIQRNAGLRVWILFFLLVMSFSLLFLDWYNP